MRLYNATVTGTLQAGENVLLQLDLPVLGNRRARISSWDASFDGLIAGNNMRVRLVSDITDGTSTEGDVPVVLDGTHFDSVGSSEPYVRWAFTALPSVGRVIDGPLHMADPSYFSKQYSSGNEVVVDNGTRVSLRCTPSNMLAAVNYKANLIFAA